MQQTRRQKVRSEYQKSYVSGKEVPFGLYKKLISDY